MSTPNKTATAPKFSYTDFAANLSAQFTELQKITNEVKQANGLLTEAEAARKLTEERKLFTLESAKAVLKSEAEAKKAAKAAEQSENRRKLVKALVRAVSPNVPYSHWREVGIGKMTDKNQNQSKWYLFRYEVNGELFAGRMTKSGVEVGTWSETSEHAAIKSESFYGCTIWTPEEE